jgi:hypothetical protein
MVIVPPGLRASRPDLGRATGLRPVAPTGWIALTAVLVVGPGCLPRLRPPPPELPRDPAALLAEVRAAQARVTSVEGRARVTVDAASGSGGTEQWLAAERPDRLRIESRDFFGNVTAILAVDGQELTLLDARAGVFYRGAATAANVGRLVPVALAPSELVTLLCGSVPLLDGDPVDLQPADGAWRLTLRHGGEEQELDVVGGGAVVRSRLRRAGASALEADLQGHRLQGGQRLPAEVALRAPLTGVALSLRWREQEVNGHPDPALFRQAPPPGAKVVELEEPPAGRK